MTERRKLLLRLDPEVHDAIARWAADELRSVNAQIEYALRLALASAGRQPRGRGGQAPPADGYRPRGGVGRRGHPGTYDSRVAAFVTAPVRVEVPATSANLGPGFDALGLALALHDVVTAEVTAGGVHVAVRGEGAGELPVDESHLVARCMLTTFERLGVTPPGLAVRCDNRIPQARGLGSSSAAIVAGILAARALLADGAQQLPEPEVLRLANEIEGHPDNVAPCLLGGFTIAWLDGPEAVACAVRLGAAPGVTPVVFIPQERGLTAHARAALPATVPHRDAAHNAGRAALLVHALTRAPELLFPATEDRLHQNYRAPGMPETAALVEQLRSVGVPAVVSGAGPTVLAFGDPAEMPVTPGWRVSAWGIDTVGARVGVDWGHAERDAVAAGRVS